MKTRKNRWLFLAFGVFITLCGTAYLFMAQATKCDQFAEPSVLSPSGEWIAAAIGDACPIGFLSVTDYSVSVTLKHQTPSTQAKPTVIFMQTDAGASPTLTWASANELVIRLNEPGNVQISGHESEGVQIRYVVTNWIWKSAQTIEVDRARDENEEQALYKQGKISEKDLRDVIKNLDDVAKERIAFRQWIINNAIIEAAAN